MLGFARKISGASEKLRGHDLNTQKSRETNFRSSLVGVAICTPKLVWTLLDDFRRPTEANLPRFVRFVLLATQNKYKVRAMCNISILRVIECVCIYMHVGEYVVYGFNRADWVRFAEAPRR